MDFLKKLFQRKPKIVKIDITKRFDLIGRVGQGSMSKVWRARDTQTGRTVALKVLDKEKTQRFEARFPPELKKPSEGHIAMSLKHPNIVSTYEFGYSLEGEQFLVMEFVEGVGLSYLVDVQNETMQKHRLSYMIQLGEALQYFHTSNWIHRDICPRNIMVSPEQELKLIDFGLAVPNTTPFRAPGNRTGTANYMAPELIKRLKTDQRIDIFSYSVTCYEMFTRKYPWKAGETLEAAVQHINQPATDIRTMVPDIDEGVAEAIMKGLQTRPDDRWQRIEQMIEKFEEAKARQDAAAKPEPVKAVGAKPAASAKPRAAVEKIASERSDVESRSSVKPKSESPTAAKSKAESPSAVKPKVESPSSAKSKIERPSVVGSSVESPSTLKAGIESPTPAKSKGEIQSNVESPSGVESQSGAESPSAVESPTVVKSGIESPSAIRAVRSPIGKPPTENTKS